MKRKFLTQFFFAVVLAFAGVSLVAHEGRAEPDDSSGGSGSGSSNSIFDPEKHKGSNPLEPKELILQEPFESTQGSKYGVLGNIGRPVIGGNSTKYEDFILDKNELNELFTSEDGAAARNQILGCGVIDQHAAMVTSMDVKEDQIKDYLNSQLAKYMLTTLYNSPALAAVYDSVESYGAKRVQMMQDRCQAVQSAASFSSEDMLRWQALQECVRANVAGSLDTTALAEKGEVTDYRSGKEAMAYAAAYRACLYGSQSQMAAFSGNPIKAKLGASNEESFDASSLGKASLEQVLERNILNPQDDKQKPSMWTGSLLDVLSHTSLCLLQGGGGGDARAQSSQADCEIMAFIPNVRWCFGSERQNQSCLNQSKPRMSLALFSPQQVFDLAYAYAQVETNYRFTFARALMNRIHISNARDIATLGEVLQEPMREEKPEILKRLQGEQAREMLAQYGCTTSILQAMDDFSGYIERAYALEQTAAGREGKKEKRLDENKTFQASDGSQVKVKEAAEEVAKNIKYPKEIGAFDVIKNLPEVMALRHGKYNDRSAAFMVQDAVRCAMISHTRGTLNDYLTLAELSASSGGSAEANAVLMAMRMRTAQMATEMIYRFLRDKLTLAQMDLQYAAPSGSSRATPPHVISTLDSVISLVDGQLSAMDALQKRQGNFASLLDRLNTERAASKGIR